MSLYLKYIAEIESRKNDLELAPLPIDGAELLSEIITQIKDSGNEHRADSLNFFIYLKLFLFQNIVLYRSTNLLPRSRRV